tara:strand:- start:2060 stop:2287 length:228 start_codon:yes stop_codon:yes gene_type:complete
MSHYYEQEQAFQAKQDQRSKEAKTKLFYKNKLSGIQMMTEMLEQELSVKPINGFKVKSIMDQVHCISSVGIDDDK